MTQPDLTVALVQSLVENAQRLGLIWTFSYATVADGSDPIAIQIIMDSNTTTGDSSSRIPAVSCVGWVTNGDRVAVISVPPAGQYIIGRLAPEQPAVAKLINTSPQSITSAGSGVPIVWSAAPEDSLSGWSATFPTRYTVKRPGLYFYTGGCTFAANNTGRRGCWWLQNSVAVNASESMGQTTALNPCAVVARPTFIRCALSDIIELNAYQESGVTLSLSGTTFEQPSLNALYIGP